MEEEVDMIVTHLYCCSGSQQFSQPANSQSKDDAGVVRTKKSACEGEVLLRSFADSHIKTCKFVGGPAFAE